MRFKEDDFVLPFQPGHVLFFLFFPALSLAGESQVCAAELTHSSGDCWRDCSAPGFLLASLGRSLPAPVPRATSDVIVRERSQAGWSPGVKNLPNTYKDLSPNIYEKEEETVMYKCGLWLSV